MHVYGAETTREYMFTAMSIRLSTVTSIYALPFIYASNFIHIHAIAEQVCLNNLMNISI